MHVGQPVRVWMHAPALRQLVIRHFTLDKTGWDDNVGMAVLATH